MTESQVANFGFSPNNNCCGPVEFNEGLVRANIAIESDSRRQ